MNLDKPQESVSVQKRDVFVIFSKARVGEAKIAIALKHELEKYDLSAFEYEDWDWIATHISHEGGEEKIDRRAHLHRRVGRAHISHEGGEEKIDRVRIRHMLEDCLVVVLISPQFGDATTGVQIEIEELRRCKSPTLLLHWSPEGWHPRLGHPALEGLNIVWSCKATALGDQDIAQNQCAHVAKKLGHASWLACVLKSFQVNHINTATRLLELIPDYPTDPLLNYRLRQDDSPPDEWIERGDVEPLTRLVAEGAAPSELEAFVHEWRAGTDLLAETLAAKARFDLAKPIRDFHASCEALCRESSNRLPELAELPSSVLKKRGFMLVRLNRTEEAIANLEKALKSVSDDNRFEVYQYLALAQADHNRPAAIASMTRAIDCSPNPKTTCLLTYDRGVLRSESGEDAVRASIGDFTFVIENSRQDTTMLHAALRARAMIRAILDDHDGAIADYTQLLENSIATPRPSVSAWMDRGALYKLKGRITDAIADWTKAIDSADAGPEQRFRSLEARGRALEETGRVLEAANDYEAMANYSSIGTSYRDELRSTVARLRS